MQKIDFNHDWTFTQEGTERFETVALPHDAIINTQRNPKMRNYFLLAGFEGGKYIYTKNFHVPGEYAGKTLILEFEAVYCMSRVYVNGEFACEKPYGFTPFQISLNSYLKFGGEKGRIIMVATIGVMFALFAVGTKLAKKMNINLDGLIEGIFVMSTGMAVLCAIAVGIAVTILSFRISIGIMGKKEF